MKSSCIALCVLVTVVTGSAQQKPASSSLPPLIDRELFFGNPEIALGDDFARRQVHRVPQAVERDDEHLGQEG